MTNYLIYGLSRTRITLYATDGVTPTSRITLQKENREGLTLAYKPEGVSHPLGSGADWAKPWTHRGFRAQLDIKWDFGLTSTAEAWTGTTWGTGASLLTATALSQILNAAFQAPCLVEPHLDKAYDFSAQPDPGKAFELKDLKGVAHSGLTISLIALTVAPLPDWATL